MCFFLCGSDDPQFCGPPDSYAPCSPARVWTDMTVEEMFVFLALTLVMPLAKMHAIRDYWRNDPIIQLPVFGKFMTRDRYQCLLRFQHFCENNNIDRNDPMFKMKLVFDELMIKFRNLMKPQQKLVIDESLVLFRGRVAFRQYIKTKRHRFGLKIFVLCDCESGCVLDMMMYAGVRTAIPENDPLGFSGAVVKEMLSTNLGAWHNLYVDNWYTSPLLLQNLYEQGTGTCGTVRENRKYMPKFGAVPKGQCEIKKCKNILVCKWTDKRSVSTLRTVHKGSMSNSGKTNRDSTPINKPDIILDYNLNMRLIDKSDMKIGSVECVRKTVKWYKKLFFHLVDVCLLKAYLYYKKATPKNVPFDVSHTTLVINICKRLVE